MLLMCKLVYQGTRRLYEDNMAIREKEREGRGRGVRKLQKVRSEELHNLCFSSIGSSNAGRSDGAAYVACIGGI